jgi:DNA-binding SARP family transcriptional activator
MRPRDGGTSDEVNRLAVTPGTGRRRTIAVLTRLCGIARANADHGAAIAAARRLVHIDPLVEESQQLLIETLDAAGQRGGAVRQFRHCRETLKHELGIEPAPQTMHLMARLAAVKRGPTPAAVEKNPASRRERRNFAAARNDNAG